MSWRRLLLIGTLLQSYFNDLIASDLSALLGSSLWYLLLLGDLLQSYFDDLLNSWRPLLSLGALLDSDFGDLLASDSGALFDSSWRYLPLLRRLA